MYHVASAGTTSGGRCNHWKAASWLAGGTATLVASSPLVIARCCLLGASRRRKTRACSCGSGHPSGGIVAGHFRLCSKVPSSDKHSWHLSSLVHLRVAASLACGHCPPVSVDNRYGICSRLHGSNCLELLPLPCSSLPATCVMSTTP